MPWLKRSTPTDTGWRDVSADLRAGTTGTMHIRRVGLHVHGRVQNLAAGTAHSIYLPPVGMRLPVSPLVYLPQAANNPSPFYLDGSGLICRDRNGAVLALGRWWEFMYVLSPGTAWIDSPPGEEVA